MRKRDDKEETGDVCTQAIGSQEGSEGYPGSVKESEICEDNSLILFFTGRDKLFQKEERNFSGDFGRCQADLLWAHRDT